MSMEWGGGRGQCRQAVRQVKLSILCVILMWYVHLLGESKVSDMLFVFESMSII
jgi:hypothetical protein